MKLNLPLLRTHAIAAAGWALVLCLLLGASSLWAQGGEPAVSTLEETVAQAPLAEKALPFYRTTWFLVFLFLDVLVVFFLVYKYRVHVITSTNQLLEQQLRERLRELSLKNNQIMLQSELLRLDKDRLDEVNEKLALTLEQLQDQHSILDEVNKKTMASIRYALRIQRSILPNYRKVKASFPESFIIFLPKDIVSGDFYWFGERDDKFCLAAIDCTGHGVPGAFMSLIGFSQLSRTFNEYGINDPSRVLVWMDRGITATLGQEKDDTEASDGMEIAFVSFDFNNKYLTFAGAHRPLYIVRNKELIEIKGEQYGVGGNKILEGDKKFTSKRFEFQSGDCIYLSSDGYVSQFGGPHLTKYKTRRFKDLLVSISDLPATYQKRALLNELHAWQGDNPQVDDILVIGIKIP